MKKRVAVTLMVNFCILLSGCGREAVKLPELKEPVSISESCCSVETGVLEIPEMDFATVIPAKYEQSFLRDAAIIRVAVEPGDMVKKGDVLAVADTGAARERLKEVKAQYNDNRKLFAITEEIYWHRIEQQAGFKKNSKSLQLLKEDFRYEREQYLQQQRELKKEKKKQQKIIQAGILRATHDGMVTSNLNLAEQNLVNAGECVVEISDLSDKILQLHILSYNKYYDNHWKKKYILVGDKQVAVKLLPYDQEVVNRTAKEGITLTVRYVVDKKDAELLEMGNVYPVYLFKNKKSEGLRIPEEAVYHEGEKNYVYVKTEEGRQRRDISCKDWTDTNWVEVTEGLKQGEQVYCRYSSGMPDGTKTKQVERKAMSIRSRSRATSRVIRREISQGVNAYGKIARVFVKKGDTVKKGTPLFQLEGTANEARLLELRYQKETLKKSRRASEKAYQEAMKTEKSGTERKLLALERKKQLQSESSELKNWETEYQKAIEEAEGKKITAQIGGTVGNVEIKAGDMVEAGQPCVKIIKHSKNLCAVEVDINRTTEPPMFGRWNAQVGAVLSMETMGGANRKKCQGICVGNEGRNNFYYIRQKGKKLSYEEMLHSMVDFSYISLPSALWVPKELVYISDDWYENREKYVWLLTEGGPVKQYVWTAEELVKDGKVMVLYGLKEGDSVCLE